MALNKKSWPISGLETHIKVYNDNFWKMTGRLRSLQLLYCLRNSHFHYFSDQLPYLIAKTTLSTQYLSIRYVYTFLEQRQMAKHYDFGKLTVLKVSNNSFLKQLNGNHLPWIKKKKKAVLQKACADLPTSECSITCPNIFIMCATY